MAEPDEGAEIRPVDAAMTQPDRLGGWERFESQMVSVLVVFAFGLGAGLAADAGQWLAAAMLVASGTMITVNVRRLAEIRIRRLRLAATLRAQLGDHRDTAP